MLGKELCPALQVMQSSPFEERFTDERMARDYLRVYGWLAKVGGYGFCLPLEP
jgi:hypothetical protein